VKNWLQAFASKCNLYRYTTGATPPSAGQGATVRQDVAWDPVPWVGGLHSLPGVSDWLHMDWLHGLVTWTGYMDWLHGLVTYWLS
jgi:hypothetical protein